jgi:hypothetical protein
MSSCHVLVDRETYCTTLVSGTSVAVFSTVSDAGFGVCCTAGHVTYCHSFWDLLRVPSFLLFAPFSLALLALFPIWTSPQKFLPHQILLPHTSQSPYFSLLPTPLPPPLLMMSLAPPSTEGAYGTVSEALTALNAFAATEDYAISRAGSSGTN